jgi:hypothetical protein
MPSQLAGTILLVPGGMMATTTDWTRLEAVVDEAFVPTSPITEGVRLADRIFERVQALRHLNTAAHHVLLFGPRGAGKTSLGFVLLERLRHDHSGIVAGRLKTNQQATFEAIFADVFDWLRKNDIPCDPPAVFTPSRVAACLRGSALQQSFVVLFDEFEGPLPEETRTRVAEVLKEIGDLQATALTARSQFIFLGIAENAADLIKSHASLWARQLQTIRIGPMTLPASREIVELGFRHLATVNWPQTRDEAERTRLVQSIALLSCGLPSLTHRLANETCKSAIRRRSDEIKEIDFGTACQQLAMTYQDNPIGFLGQLRFPDKSLLSCATARVDDFAWSGTPQVRDAMRTLWNRTDLTDGDFEERLKKHVDGGLLDMFVGLDGEDDVTRFRFRNMLDRAGLIIVAVHNRWLTLPQLQQLWYHDVDRLLDEAGVLADEAARTYYDADDVPAAAELYRQFKQRTQAARNATDSATALALDRSHTQRLNALDVKDGQLQTLLGVASESPTVG